MGVKMEKTKMYKIREILRLHEQLQYSNRAISKALNICKSTVNDFIKKFNKAEIFYPDIHLTVIINVKLQ